VKVKVVSAVVGSLFATLLIGAVSPASASTVNAPASTKPSGVSASLGKPTSAGIHYGLAQSDDSSLSALSIVDRNGSATTAFNPLFSPEIHNYVQVTFSPQIMIAPMPSSSGATVTVSVDDGASPIDGSNYSKTLDGFLVPVSIDLTGHKPVTVISVTVTDGASTTTYTISEYWKVAPPTKLVSISPSSGSYLGGETITATYSGIPSSASNNYGSAGCSIPFPFYVSDDFYFGNPSDSFQFIWPQSIRQDATTGYTIMVFGAPNQREFKPDTVDLHIRVFCASGSEEVSETANTIKNAYTYVVPHIDSVTAPDVVTTGTAIRATGVGVTGYASLGIRLFDPATKTSGQVSIYQSTTNRSLDAFVSSRAEFPDGAQLQLQITLRSTVIHAQWGDYSEPDFSNPDYSQTVKWKTPKPQRLSVTPTFSGLAGGKTVTLHGHFLSNYDPCAWMGEGCAGGMVAAKVTINGVPLTNVNLTSALSTCEFGEGWGSWADCTSNGDVITGTIPPSLKAGSYDLVVTNKYGTTTFATKFVYGVAPTIKSISPSTVSKDGGAVVTLSGSGFGPTGRPIVTFNGIKSPAVTRVSDTSLTAVVPPSATTGNAEVQVKSPVGGGYALTPGSITYGTSSANPTVSNVSPNTADVAGGTSVTLTGTNFGASGTQSVKFTQNINGTDVVKYAQVTSVTATTLTFDTPSSDSFGTASITVATPQGFITQVGAFTYTSAMSINVVSPNMFASYLTGNDAKFTITGHDLGPTGTVTVGTQAPQSYVAVDGTTIHDVAIDLSTLSVGSYPVVVRPMGAANPLTTSVSVTGPKIKYVGPEFPGAYLPGMYNTQGDSGGLYESPTQGKNNLSFTVDSAGGTVVKVQGKGFGPDAGTLQLVTALDNAATPIAVTTDTWSDTEITFTAPALSVEYYNLIVTPANNSVVSATYLDALMSAEVFTTPTVSKIEATNPTSVQSNGPEMLNQFTLGTDSTRFTISGDHFLGRDNSASTVVELGVPYNSGGDAVGIHSAGSGWYRLNVVSMSDNQIVVEIPSIEYPAWSWGTIGVTTSQGYGNQTYGIWFGDGAANPYTTLIGDDGYYNGLCMTDAQAGDTASGNATAAGYSPAVLDISSVNGSLFSDNSTVTMYTTIGSSTSGEYVALDVLSQTGGNQIQAAMPSTGGLTNPWGVKYVVVHDLNTESPLPDQVLTFNCQVRPLLVTQLDGSTSTVTKDVADAGSTVPSYVEGTPGFMTNPSVANDYEFHTGATASSYEYLLKSTYDQNSGSFDVAYSWNAGLPISVGDYMVRVAPSQADYSATKFILPIISPVEYVLTGAHLKVQAKFGTNIPDSAIADSAATITYRGQLGDGTNGSNEDVSFNANTSTDSGSTYTGAAPSGVDEITQVNYEWRDHTCSSYSDTDAPWTPGLPKDVLTQNTSCGGDGTTISAYDVRVASVVMDSSGQDRARYFAVDKGTPITVTINKRKITFGASHPSKIYDGTSTANVTLTGIASVTGVSESGPISGEDLSVDGNYLPQYPDANVGSNLNIPISSWTLVPSSALGNYELVNVPASTTGSITKSTGVINPTVASSVLFCASSHCTSSVTTSITTADTDFYSNRDISTESGIAPIVYTATTGSICSVDSAGVVTAKAVGSCVVTVTQASSGNFNASVTAADNSSTVATIEITVTGNKYTPLVQVNDWNMSTVDSQTFDPQNGPTVQIDQIASGDSISGFTFSYTLDGAEFVPPTDSSAWPIGTYTVTATSGTPTYALPDMYTSDIKYVAGTLTVTGVPPVIDQISPIQGPEAGGTDMTITGSNLDTVKTINMGGVVLKKSSFRVNADGTELYFTSPPGYGNVDVLLSAGDAEASNGFTYISPDNPVSTLDSMSPTCAVPGLPQTVTFTGRHLEQVTTVDFGTTTLQPADFQVNADGSQLSLVVPDADVNSAAAVTLHAPSGDVSTTDYQGVCVNSHDVNLNLNLKLNVGAVLKGAKATLTGGGLQASSDYTLTMHSTAVVLYTGKSDVNGNFTQLVHIPQAACVNGGLHELTLTGIDPSGNEITSVQWLALSDACVVLGMSKTGVVTIADVYGLLFEHNSSVLTANDKKLLREAKRTLKVVSQVTYHARGYDDPITKSQAKKLSAKRLAAINAYVKTLVTNHGLVKKYKFSKLPVVTKTITVYFVRNSAVVGSNSMAKLQKLLNQILGKYVVKGSVNGFVEPVKGMDDYLLSKARVREVNKYLVRHGLKAKVVLSAKGRAKGKGGKTRRVVVTISIVELLHG